MFVRLCSQFVERRTDQLMGIAVSGKVVRQQTFLDVAVAVIVCPVAEIAMAQFLPRVTPARGVPEEQLAGTNPLFKKYTKYRP